MPLSRPKMPATPSRGRRAEPSCRGGASSLLRLGGAAALPAPWRVTGWPSRIAQPFAAAARAPFAPSEFGPAAR